ncbi:hypothetical protein VTN96DRAFT_418 [Rasamsonia emersonii]
MTDDAHDQPVATALEEEVADDTDSAVESSLGNLCDKTSLASSVKNYVYEPNDKDEQDRLDLSYHIYNLCLGGELHRAPLKNPQKVLDLGTGTGIWAIDFADMNPQAEVIGKVPPNCRFEIDNFEEEWNFSRPFDFIHGRELEGSIRDHDRLFAQCFRNLSPEGFLEMKSMQVEFSSDDGTHTKAEHFSKVVDLIHEAANKFGKSMATITTWKERMEKAGFKNVKQETYKLPHGSWPKDPKPKEIGIYHQHNTLDAMGPYTYALLTRYLNWKREEVEVLLTGARKEIKDPSIHSYSNLYVIYGQKPED